MASEMISLDLHGEDELFKLKITRKWKWYHGRTKKPDNAWQTSLCLRCSYNLFNVFSLSITCLCMSTFPGRGLLLLTRSALLLWQMELVDICFTLSSLAFHNPCAFATFRMCRRRHINWLLSWLITFIDPYHPLAIENINGIQWSQSNGTHFLLRWRRCDISRPLNMNVSSTADIYRYIWKQ